MSIDVSTTVKVQDVSEFSWGTVLRCSHAHRAKNDAGEWETKSYSNIDVVTSPDLGVFQKGDRIIVQGYATGIAGYNKKDGTIGATLRLKATQIDLAPAYEEATQKQDIPF